MKTESKKTKSSLPTKMDPMKGFWVKGAREHNLKSIDVFIPRNEITVITGVSGSGKSSLAFNTIYAEGQRRYIESLSAYARFYIDKLKPPDVDLIFGLSPVVAIDQKTISANPRSTVGTVTQIYDYLRLLMARLGTPKCPTHDTLLVETPVDEVIANVMKMPKGTSFKVFSPTVRNQKGEMQSQLQKYKQLGLMKVIIDKKMKNIEDIHKLDKRKSHNLEVLIDHLYIDKKYLSRLKKSFELAVELSQGFIRLVFEDGSKKTYSTLSACPDCLYSVPDLDPKLFSFNSPSGACEECKGMGYLDEELEDEEEGAGVYMAPSYSYEEIEDEEEDIFVCSGCEGKRLNKEALSVWIQGKNIADLSNMDLEELDKFLKKAKFPVKYAIVAEKIITKIRHDLEVLTRVGVSYLTLGRTTRSLSGGEAQRIRLASQLSSALVGVLYILDEPSIGLHPADHQALLSLIETIKERRNTVIIVEHDENTIKKADYIVDIGPRAGNLGGHLVHQGSIASMLKNRKSITADYLTKRKKIEVPTKRRKSDKYLEIKGAKGNNLKNVDFKVPLGTLTTVTGVSGSGKSTLVVDTLYRILACKLYKSQRTPLEYKKLIGDKDIDKVIIVDQKPIGRTSRSVPATYVGMMSLVRVFMSFLPAAKVRGFTASHFSFNVKAGRCDYCEGLGYIKQEMSFLSHSVVPCDVCVSKRYSPEVLSVTYKDKNIADILSMTVRQALEFFDSHPRIRPLLKNLSDVGLSYLTLGQSSSSLSGGEAQRIKLTKELSKRDTGHSVYILDEPTTGLHFDDIKKLIQVLNRLVDRGNTVIVIEHNMDLIKSSDYVVDLGPIGGKKGGYIQAQGTPEQVSRVRKSVTSKYIREALAHS